VGRSTKEHRPREKDGRREESAMAYLDVDLKELVVAMIEEITETERPAGSTAEQAYNSIFRPGVDTDLINRVEAGCIRIMRIYNDHAKLVP
jgi:hypothetical protein